MSDMNIRRITLFASPVLDGVYPSGLDWEHL